MLLKTFRDFNVEHLKAKKCLHAVDRRYDPFCGVISLMLGCALVEAKGSMQRKRVFRKFGLPRKDHSNEKKRMRVCREARFLCQRAGVSYSSTGVALDQIRKFCNLAPFLRPRCGDFFICVLHDPCFETQSRFIWGYHLFVIR